MESLYAYLALLLAILNVVLLALVLNARDEIKKNAEARGELWDAYASLLSENTRSHETLMAARDAHKELQRAFLHVCSTERVA